jgi:prepilin-type N-terminal cleavage/methylation domain-containing protein
VSESKLSYPGFTLVELSLVIVIIGFIVAGIVGGQTLVKQAQLRSTFSKMQAYKSATMSFKDIYNDLPGDFKQATSYWPGGVTEDGDGNRRIDGWALVDEDLCFFPHLSLSQVINESFSYSGAAPMFIGQTNPKTPFSNVTIYAINTSDLGGGGNVANKNVLVLAAKTTTFVAQGAAVSAKETSAFHIQVLCNESPSTDWTRERNFSPEIVAEAPLVEKATAVLMNQDCIITLKQTAFCVEWCGHSQQLY